jgi:hypothetical protein
MLHPSGVASPAYSAIVQQFLRGKPASKPSTNPRARRRGSTLRKTRPDADHHLIKQPQPPARLYAVASGHRKIVVCCHETG